MSMRWFPARNSPETAHVRSAGWICTWARSPSRSSTRPVAWARWSFYIPPAHHAANQVFLDGPDHAQDPTEGDYTPPSSA